MRVIVVGAGPSGMMCAGIMGQNGAEVLLIERNDKVGRKLMITGKGRCNVTNNCSNDSFIKNVSTNGRFLYSAINNFSTADLMSFFENRGCKLKTERGNRVFPVSFKSSDIVDTLFKFVTESGVKILKGRVCEVIVNNGKVVGVRTCEGKVFKANFVVIACGGKSYPGTGSTGDGYLIAQKLGHTIVDPRPSLVPLIIKQSFCKELQGLTLKNISIKVIDNERKQEIYRDFGELLFTHFGVSGPVILSASAHMRDIKKEKYSITIDLKPALTENQLDARILRDVTKNLHKSLSNSLYELMPKKLIPIIIKVSGIDPYIKCDSLTKDMRKSLVKSLKSFKLDVLGFRSINESIVTSGGVSTKEINPKTMESKVVKGVFFAGEIIDVDAYTGGFNLQIAFSTGYTVASALLAQNEI